MSESEIEAAAAAIVNQARTLALEPLPATIDQSNKAATTGARQDSHAPSVLRMSERDRLWLIVGLVGCVVLILVAIAFVRVLNVPPTPR